MGSESDPGRHGRGAGAGCATRPEVPRCTAAKRDRAGATQANGKSRNRVLKVMLPHAKHRVTRCAESRRDLAITSPVAGELLRPVRAIVFGHPVMLGAPMPVAAISEDHESQGR